MYVQPDEEEGTLPFFKYLKITAAICCLFSAVLLIDLILPGSCKQEVVQKRLFYKENNRFGANDYQLHVVTPTFKIKVGPPLFEDATEQTQVEVCYSPILKMIRKVSGSTMPGGKQFSHKVTPPVYMGYGSFPLVLLFLGCATLFLKDESISYGAGILTVIVLTTMLIIL